MYLIQNWSPRNSHSCVHLKSKGKTCMVEEPSHVKQLSLNHVCKIGLTFYIDVDSYNVHIVHYFPG
jgi:hypothetical protein